MTRRLLALAALALLGPLPATAAAGPDATRPPTPADAAYFVPASHLELSFFASRVAATGDGPGDVVLASELAYARKLGPWQPAVRVPVVMAGSDGDWSATVGNLELALTRLGQLPQTARAFVATGYALRAAVRLPTAGDVLAPPRLGQVIHHPDAVGLYRPDVTSVRGDAAIRADLFAWGGFFLELRAGLERGAGDADYTLASAGGVIGLTPFGTRHVGVLYELAWERELDGEVFAREDGVHLHRPGLHVTWARWGLTARYLFVDDGFANQHGGSCDLHVRF